MYRLSENKNNNETNIIYLPLSNTYNSNNTYPYIFCVGTCVFFHVVFYGEPVMGNGKRDFGWVCYQACVTAREIKV